MLVSLINAGMLLLLTTTAACLSSTWASREHNTRRALTNDEPDGRRGSAYWTIHCNPSGGCMKCPAAEEAAPHCTTGWRMLLVCDRTAKPGKTYTSVLRLPHNMTVMQSSSRRQVLGLTCMPNSDEREAVSMIRELVDNPHNLRAYGQDTASLKGSDGALSLLRGTDEQSEDDAVYTEAVLGLGVNQAPVQVASQTDGASASSTTTGLLAGSARKLLWQVTDSLAAAVSRQLTAQEGSARSDDAQVVHVDTMQDLQASGQHPQHWSLWEFELGMLLMLGISLPVVYWRKMRVRHL